MLGIKLIFFYYTRALSCMLDLIYVEHYLLQNFILVSKQVGKSIVI